MWVVAEDGQVGVVNAISAEGIAEFHRVGADGMTELIIRYPVATLKQARLRDIPENRRPVPGTARKFGYL